MARTNTRPRRRGTPARLAAVCALVLAGACVAPPPGPPATPTGLAASVATYSVTVRWAVPPGPEPAAFVVESRPLGAASWSPSPGTVDVARRTFTSPMPDRLDPVAVEVRVTAVGATSLRSAPSAPLRVDIPPSRGTSRRFAYGTATTLATATELRDAGLDVFPDGLISLLPTDTPGMYDWYASQGNAGLPDGSQTGAGIGHTRGPLDDPLAAVVTTRGAIVGVDPTVDYVGAGSLWRDEATGASLMLYHRERYDGADRYYTSIGAARSADGVTFTDLGEVLTPDIERGSPRRADKGTGPGDVSLVVRGPDVYAYFNDNLAADGDMVLALARTTVAQLRTAATGGAAPVFTKWHQGAFSQPGVGGTPTPVSVGFQPSVIADPCGGYLLVSHADSGPDSTRLQVAASADGITWAPPELVPGTLSGFRIYNTLVGDHVAADGQRSAGPGTLRLLSLRFASPDDVWSQPELQSVPLTDARAPGCTPG